MPFCEKRIDLMVFSPKEKELVAIEVKVSNWKKAVMQATLNLPVVDKSYIAIYDKFVHRVKKDYLNDNSIGLISVGSKWGEIEYISQPSCSPLRNEIFMGKVKKDFARGHNGNQS